MRITLVSPYHGGSHRAWAGGYRAHSAHDVSLLTLPARFWKWRMHGGAVTLARRFREEGHRPDLILATDMLDLTTFLALTRPQTARTPAVLYLHENQLTYPLPGDPGKGAMRRQRGERDLHYVFVNYASMLAANAVLFNSHYHRDSLFAALPNFLKHFPEYNELATLASLREKSHVLPVGVDFAALEKAGPGSRISNQSPLILWNQRWEYDKNPAAFFDALYTVAGEGLDFRVALCGERFRQRPAEFDEARARLGDRIVHVGYAAPEKYRALLWEAGITISTAIHEFFGISILEAIHCHTFPILPHRLSYPELIPEPYHLKCLYQNQGGLVQRLRRALTHPGEAATTAAALAPSTLAYSWPRVAPRYDAFFAQL